MRVGPCCCIICCCPKETHFSRKKIQFIKICVNQLAYIQTGMIFLLVVLSLSGDLKIGNMSPNDPYLYIAIILIISFLTGMWGLMTLFEVEATYEFLQVYRYKRKARMLKIIIVLTNLQGFVLDSLSNYEIIPCAGPMISSKTMGSIIKSVLTMGETIVIGTFMFANYMLRTSHV